MNSRLAALRASLPRFAKAAALCLGLLCGTVAGLAAWYPFLDAVAYSARRADAEVEAGVARKVEAFCDSLRRDSPGAALETVDCALDSAVVVGLFRPSLWAVVRMEQKFGEGTGEALCDAAAGSGKRRFRIFVERRGSEMVLGRMSDAVRNEDK